MNTTIHIYVPDKDIKFTQWAQNRFKRNFSKMVIKAMRDFVGDEWADTEGSDL